MAPSFFPSPFSLTLSLSTPHLLPHLPQRGDQTCSPKLPDAVMPVTLLESFQFARVAMEETREFHSARAAGGLGGEGGEEWRRDSPEPPAARDPYEGARGGNLGPWMVPSLAPSLSDCESRSAMS